MRRQHALAERRPRPRSKLHPSPPCPGTARAAHVNRFWRFLRHVLCDRSHVLSCRRAARQASPSLRTRSRPAPGVRAFRHHCLEPQEPLDFLVQAPLLSPVCVVVPPGLEAWEGAPAMSPVIHFIADDVLPSWCAAEHGRHEDACTYRLCATRKVEVLTECCAGEPSINSVVV